MSTEGTDRRESVLESALSTFARFGYRKTSMEQVAQAAQISRPGLYFLFESKEALFRAAVTRMLERDLAVIEGVLNDPEKHLPQRLQDAFDQWAGRYIGPLARDIWQVIDDNPGLLGDIVVQAPQRFEQLLTQALAKDPKDTDRPEQVAQTLISASIGIKVQAETREVYQQRLKVAIDLLTTAAPSRRS